MQIGSGEEAEFRDGCLSLRAGTIAKLRAAQSPGFSGQIPNGLGRQPLSKFRCICLWKSYYVHAVGDYGMLTLKQGTMWLC